MSFLIIFLEVVRFLGGDVQESKKKNKIVPRHC